MSSRSSSMKRSFIPLIRAKAAALAMHESIAHESNGIRAVVAWAAFTCAHLWQGHEWNCATCVNRTSFDAFVVYIFVCGVHTIRMLLSSQNWKDDIIGVRWSVLSQRISLFEEINSRAVEIDRVEIYSSRKNTDVTCGGLDCNQIESIVFLFFNSSSNVASRKCAPRFEHLRRVFKGDAVCCSRRSSDNIL